MRICFIANANSIHTRRVIQPILDRGHSVSLVSYIAITQKWRGLSKLVDLTVISNKPKFRFLYWGRWLRRLLVEEKPDVLHSLQLTAAGWLGVLAGYHPFVASAWGSDLLTVPNLSIFRKNMLQAVLSRCDALEVATQPMVDRALALGVPEEKIHLNPWGVETDIFKPEPFDRNETRRDAAIDPEALVILCPRGIAPNYRIDAILRATKLAIETHPKILLLLIKFNVDPSYFGELDRLIDDLELRSHVMWLPPRENQHQMAQLYRAADVVISTPVSEGFGFSVYEAMLSGCPTIITDLPVFEDKLISGIHTLKVPVGDPAATAKAMTDLIIDSQLRTSLRQGGLKIAREISEHDRTPYTINIYRQLTG